MKLGTFLVALMLAGMAIVPIVSAAAQVGTSENRDKNTGSVDDLLKSSEIRAIITAAESSEKMPVGETDQSKLNAYVNPAEKIKNEIKSRMYSESQIITVLKSRGYSCDLKTGACWIGTPPTEKELVIINQIRGKDYSPFDRENNIEKSTLGSLSLRQEYRQMKTTSGTTYFGVNDYMKPGQTVTSSSGTFQHVVTTHVGRKPSPSTESWTEAGVAASVADPQRRYFTYDNNEGGWSFHGNAGASAVSTYQIYVTNTLESGGYKYHIWINGGWGRTGHLAYRQNYVDQANEIWAEGSF